MNHIDFATIKLDLHDLLDNIYHNNAYPSSAGSFIIRQSDNALDGELRQNYNFSRDRFEWKRPYDIYYKAEVLLASTQSSPHKLIRIHKVGPKYAFIRGILVNMIENEFPKVKIIE